MRRSDHAAVVLGMFETGLGVARSLGRNGIRVLGLDHRPGVGFRSKYVEPSLCPNPLLETDAFVEHLAQVAKAEAQRPVLFVTSDDFLLAVARHRERLEEVLLLNLSDTATLESIADKYRQYELARSAGIPVPATFLLASPEDVAGQRQRIPFPAFVKAREVTSWRKLVGGNIKGFIANTPEELERHLAELFELGVEALVQDLIPGPDTSHYEACCYMSRDGQVARAFAFRKLRQQPPGFGFGSLVESVRDPALLELGARFLDSIGYRGVGSAEFKRDERDGELKLIELNPRYWQQNSLAERCKINFPMAEYLDLIGEMPAPTTDYEPHVKWVNMTADFDAFRVYRRRGELGVGDWIQSLGGPKVYSNFAIDDPIPGVHALSSNVAQRRPARALVKGIARFIPRTETRS